MPKLYVCIDFTRVSISMITTTNYTTNMRTEVSSWLSIIMHKSEPDLTKKRPFGDYDLSWSSFDSH